MSNKLQLGNTVMVSDPCYTPDTWCLIKLTDVKPGSYEPFVKYHEGRCSMLLVIHEDYGDVKLKWENLGSIGVDSGQAGIFSMESYRNDDLNIETPDRTYDNEIFEYPFRDKAGDAWYEKMCRFTLSEQQWGSYNEGVVTSSGWGDGFYNLYVAKYRGKIIAMCIDFAIEESTIIDFNFHKNELV